MKQDLEQRLELIKDIKKFCVEELGIDKNNSFTKVSDQKAVYVIYACPKYSIESALSDWNSAYTNRKKRDWKTEILRRKNLDVYNIEWEASGEHPQIMPGVLQATNTRLIYLVIHENVHLHLRNRDVISDYNLPLNIEEPVADNIAYKGALMYYENNKLMQHYINKDKEERDLYENKFNKCLRKLNQAYAKDPEYGRKLLPKFGRMFKDKNVNNAFFFHGSFYHENAPAVDKILYNMTPKECITQLNKIVHVTNLKEFKELMTKT